MFVLQFKTNFFNLENKKGDSLVENPSINSCMVGGYHQFFLLCSDGTFVVILMNEIKFLKHEVLFLQKGTVINLPLFIRDVLDFSVTEVCI